MIWTADSSGNTIFVSPDLTTLMGIDLARAAGFGWLQRVHEDDLGTVETTFGKACVEQLPFTLRYRLRLADGRFYWVAVGANPSFGPPDQTFLGFLGSLQTLCEDIGKPPIRAYGEVGEFTPSQSRDQGVSSSGLDHLIADALLVARSFADKLGRGQIMHAIDIALYLVGLRLGSAGVAGSVDRIH